MGKKKRNRDLGPKRKRMKRSQRLQSAIAWTKKYEGKNIIKSYAKWYGVTSICAITELEMLEMKFSEKKKAQLRQGEADRVRKKQIRKIRRDCKESIDGYGCDFDETFAFIAGYTEGGIPFGITYEEMEEYDALEETVEYNSHRNHVKASRDDWFSEFFVWENYFGESRLLVDQEQMIIELNKLDILSTDRGNWCLLSRYENS